MIRKYTCGSPIETDAVVQTILAEKTELPFFTKHRNACELTYELGNDDIVYGLGENVRGINKKGWIYVSNCTDDSSHLEDTVSLYAAHNFIVVDGTQTFGLFLDYPGKVQFDIGYSNLDQFVITMDDPDYNLYIITASDVPSIVHEFRQLIGRSYIPPKWAFGYGQSRWGYKTAKEVKEVVKNYRDNHIPLDSVYMDIDYMERFKDFTIDETTFPKFEEFVQEMKEQHIHLVPIIDAGVKIEDGYDVYEEGVANQYFCKEEDGSNFTAGVWPGKVHFPDMLNADARRWFGHKYQFLLDKGIEGFWNDMNEPALFYSERHLKEVFSKLEEYKTMNLDIQSFFEMRHLLLTIANNPEDYKRFYHNMNGKLIRHDLVHNLFGYNMTRAAQEAFEEIVPEKRILLFSRSSYIGMHRYGGIWTGDNKSWWSHLLLNIKMMPSLNMCGFLYTGADLGGFGANTTRDLLLRWLEFGIFSPLMRNHAALATRQQEVYQFGETNSFTNILGIRYGLLPYIYSEFMKSALRSKLYFRPLAFDYLEDARAKRVEDQLLVGDSIMVAPVYEQNAVGRYVYLPETMKMIRFRSLWEREEKIVEAGDHYIEIPLDEVVLFLRPGKILPLSSGGECVETVNFSELELLINGDIATYELYNDDGYSKDYENPDNYCTIKVVDGCISCTNNDMMLRL